MHGHHVRGLKKRLNAFLFECLLFFFPKKSMQRERQRERHGNHVLAAKHRKIIWHNLIYCKRQSILPLKFTLLMEMPCDFRKRNAGLVFYLMAEGGIEDKKIGKKKKVVPFIEGDHRVLKGSTYPVSLAVSAPGGKSTAQRLPSW